MCNGILLFQKNLKEILRIQKQMIDFYESIKNNILYPGEKEITLKDKGFGSKIIEIMPVNI